MGASTAVLVIDLQVGALDGKLVPAIDRSNEVLERTRALIDAARRGDSPVIYVQHCDATDKLFTEETPRWEIHPSIAPEPGEPVVRKRESSAFDGTPLRGLLDEKGVDTVVVCGLQSEFCVTNTGIGALENGLGVVVAADAHGTWASGGHEAAEIVARQNALLAGRGASVEPVSAIVQRLEGA